MRKTAEEVGAALGDRFLLLWILQGDVEAMLASGRVRSGKAGNMEATVFGSRDQ